MRPNPTVLTPSGGCPRTPFRGALIPVRDDVLERLSAHVADELGSDQCKGPGREARHAARDVRGEEHAWSPPECVLGRKRLRVGDIKRRSEPSGRDLLDRRISVHDSPARSVHEERTIRHRREKALRRPSRRSPLSAGPRPPPHRPTGGGPEGLRGRGPLRGLGARRVWCRLHRRRTGERRSAPRRPPRRSARACHRSSSVDDGAHRARSCSRTNIGSLLSAARVTASTHSATRLCVHSTRVAKGHAIRDGIDESGRPRPTGSGALRVAACASSRLGPPVREGTRNAISSRRGGSASPSQKTDVSPANGC